MNLMPSVREQSPLRVLLVALLAAVLLAQLAAMAFVAHSQVEKAEARDAAERSLQIARRAPVSTAKSMQEATTADVVKVDYAFAE